MHSLAKVPALLPDDEQIGRLDSLVPVAAQVVAGSDCRKTRRAAFVVSSGIVSIWSWGTIKGCPTDCYPACAEMKDYAGKGCIHAEQSAIREACRTLSGGTMVHLKLDQAGQLVPSGRRYCPICLPKMLVAGIEWLALYHADGWWMYRLISIEEVGDEHAQSAKHPLPARS